MGEHIIVCEYFLIKLMYGIISSIHQHTVKIYPEFVLTEELKTLQELDFHKYCSY